MKLKTMVKFEIKGLNGRHIVREWEGRSWLLQLFGILLHRMQNAAVANLRDITNTLRTVSFVGADSSATGGPFDGAGLAVGPGGGMGLQYPYAAAGGNPGGVNNPLDSEQVGIVLGTGNTVATPIDYVVETRIQHGLAAGQILYGGTGLDSLIFADPNGSIIFRRALINVSGGNITLNEVCIYALDHSGGTIYTFCIYRDIIAGGLAIVNGDVISAAITMSTVV